MTSEISQEMSYADLIELLVVVIRYEVSEVCSKTPQNGAAAAKLVHTSNEQNALHECILTAAGIAINGNWVTRGSVPEADCEIARLKVQSCPEMP